MKFLYVIYKSFTTPNVQNWQIGKASYFNRTMRTLMFSDKSTVFGARLGTFSPKNLRGSARAKFSRSMRDVEQNGA